MVSSSFFCTYGQGTSTHLNTDAGREQTRLASFHMMSIDSIAKRRTRGLVFLSKTYACQKNAMTANPEKNIHRKDMLFISLARISLAEVYVKCS
jgi:hypothetical protein